MIKAIITNETSETKSGTSGRGKAYSITQQECMLHFPSGEVRRHHLTLEPNAMPLLKGTYSPGASAAYLDGFDLKLSTRARDWVKA